MLIRRGEDPEKVQDREMAIYFEKHLAQVQSWLAGQPNFRTMYVDYNRMIHEPAPIVGHIIEFLGQQLDERRMVAAVDPGLYRQRVGSIETARSQS